MAADQVAIVTGAGRGVGAATARLFRRRGLYVVAVDHDERAVKSVAADGIECVIGDVTETATAEQAVECATAHGDLRALVNNAGLAIDRAFMAQTDDEWQRVTAAILGGTRTMTRAVVAQMQRNATEELAAGPDATATPRRISSTVPATTLTATAGGSASAAAGGAVQALTRTLARELGGYGIRVNAVMVGFVTTRMTQPLDDLTDTEGFGLPEPVRQMAAATTALGRFGSPEEIATVHAFLCSPAADYVTGAVVPVTGGLLGT